MTSARYAVGPWVAYAAALWAAVFAVFHIIWAAGWYPLLNAAQARAAFAITWKWVYLVIVTAMFIIAVPVALTPVTTWGLRLPQRLMYRLAWIGTTLLVLRLVALVAQTVYLAAVGRFRFSLVGHWDWWFILGAVLFSASTWRWRWMRGGPS
ncbi:MAG TPA: hypothetical protein VKD28_17615 [Gemmatimonadales bacterium]|nr:hypothetical protein [Gemmatimonadales bacterium]